MAKKQTTSLAFQLRKTTAVLLAIGLAFTGVLLFMLNTWLEKLDLGPWEWLHTIPLGEIAGGLFGAGAVSTIFEYHFRKSQEHATKDLLEENAKRYEETVRKMMPTMRDTVIEGFAINPEDLKRVAAPELLDDIASNVMALRLGDEQFAREIYTDIRDQVIRAAERWSDTEVRVRLSTAVERNTRGVPLFDVTVEWEYMTTPAAAVRRFACVSDRAEYNDLLLDVPATSPWLMTPRPGMDASSRDCYELLELTVDGRAQTIRRTARKTGQTYSVHLDGEARSGEPVRIRQIVRLVTPRSGHRLYFELPQPARDFSLTVDYSNTDIAQMSASESVATAKPIQVLRTPAAASGKTISVNAPGWLLPKTGFTFTWALESELPRAEERREAA